MSVLWAAFLGLVQGLAEFLPISSSGHLSIIQNLFGVETSEGNLFFDVLLHLGTLVAVCAVYWDEIVAMVKDFVAFFGGLGKSPQAGRPKKHYPAARLVFMLIVATLPLFLILPVSDYVEQLFTKTWFVGITLILTGALLFLADRMPRGKKTEKTMTAANALVVGLCQAVATIPGLSRSGTTITAGLATGLDREFAVKFSFLLSIPAVVGANILSIIDAVKQGVDMANLPAYFVGMLAAAVSGYFAIGFVKRLAKSGRFGWFSYYCWTVGVLAIILTIVL